MIPSLNENTGLDGSDFVPGASGRKAHAGDPVATGAAVPATTGDSSRMDEDDFDLTDTDLLQIVSEAESTSTSYLTSQVRTNWNRSLKAFRNEHFEGSKYLSSAFAGRSKLFRPKTRSAVRKDMANAAEALFATADVVKITAEDETDPTQRASAAIKQELLNYRLARSSGKAGIPWFIICMGARQDADVLGICVSKQHWEYKERTRHEPLETPYTDVETGEETTHEAKTEVVLDRPNIASIPPENVLIDPAADWTNPAQSSKYLMIRYPMHVSAVLDMVKAGPEGMIPWRSVTEEELKSQTVTPSDAAATRRAREGGLDPKDKSATGSRFGIVWVYEVFLEHGGEQYTFWTIGKNKLISDVVLTEEAYPHLGGERPIVIGFGALDAHRLFPMSPVESWQQLQQEANDTANLRLDAMKAAVTPVTKVRRGRQVDIAQLQRRGPNGVIMVNAMEDVEWDRPPDVPASSFQSEAIINSDFDALAGDFNSSSVETNRRLNDTVGGMKLLAGSSSTLTGFDLRVWSETWLEPVLWQLVKLEEFYESDETILAIAGNRAKLMQKFGIDEITDHMLMAQSTLKVNVGTGGSNADPMQDLQKFELASKVAMEVLAPFFERGEINVQPNVEEIISEIYGKAGYKDAGERFFKVLPPKPPQGPPPDPKSEAQAQLLQQKAQLDADAHQRKGQQDQQAHELKAAETAQKLDQAGKIAQMKVQQEMTRTEAIKAKADADRMVAQSKAQAAAIDVELERRRVDIENARFEIEQQRLQLERDKAKLAREQLQHERKASSLKAEATITQAKAQSTAAKYQAKAAQHKASQPIGGDKGKAKPKR
jgi:hypothetical protein